MWFGWNIDWRTISKLACTKKKYETSSQQENITNLMVLSSKNDILDVININKIIEKFASKNKKKLFV